MPTLNVSFWQFSLPIEKLHNYTFSRPVTVHTDHKPLESIFVKPISLAPARLQRMLLYLTKYDITVKYVGAKSVLLADTLSRLVKPRADKEIPGLDVNIAGIMKIKLIYLKSLCEETKSDETLVTLKDHIITGWPNSMQDLPVMLHPYWCFQDELTVLDGVIIKGNQVIVPASMRPETLEHLYDAHQGLTSTLQRAHQTVYWPKMQDDITELINQCTECQVHAKKKPRVPEQQIQASRLAQILGADLIKLNRQVGLVIIDFFSGYLTYDPLDGEGANLVIEALNKNFQKFRLVEEIITDNGPCF